MLWRMSQTGQIKPTNPADTLPTPPKPAANPALPEYVVASREGLYFASRERHRRVADGQFFGVTIRGDDIYCFKTLPLDAARANPHGGSIVRYRYAKGEISAPELLVSGLDHNCHQIDFISGMLRVVDTEHQRILDFDDRWRLSAEHPLLPPAPARTPGHAHINSILGVGDSIYVLFHNLSTGRPSEIVEFDPGFHERHRIQLRTAGCHDIVRLEDGRLLYCESLEGAIARDDGWRLKIDGLFTRGLSVGPNEIVVGSSLFGKRAARAFLPGFLTFFDRSYRRTGRLYLPAAPTQIRRLDGADLSLSTPR